MKKELELFLSDKYPRMFRDYGGDPRHTCMAWGMSHGDGWFGILCKMCENIQKVLDKNPELVEGFKFAQIKEKFGTLRVYVDGGNKEIWDIIDQAERQSGLTCEECGTTEGNITTKGGWIRTLCDPCRYGGKTPVMLDARTGEHIQC
jgi:hypothetical protein